MPKRTKRGRASTALAWGLGAFAALQVGLGAAAEAFPRLRDPMYGDKFVKLKRHVSDRPLVVMLGSSRTGMAFHGRRVEEALGGRVTAFNFGTPAAGPVTQLVYLRRMLDAGVAPDLLLVEVLPTMLTDGPAAPLEQNWFLGDRLLRDEVPVVIRHGFDADTVTDRWWRSVLLPWHTLRFQILSHLSASMLPGPVRMDWSRVADERGWITLIRQDVTDAERVAATNKARLEYGPTLHDLRPGGPAVAALRELLDLCRERGVAVRLVLMPEGGSFRSWYSPIVRDRVSKCLADLPAEVIDAREWLPDAAFNDGHHMLVVGAERFSERLARDVIGPQMNAIEKR